MDSELQGFLDGAGRLTALPAKRSKKLLALIYIAEKLPDRGEYTEKSFNEILKTLHTFNDAATLRRELYVFGFIDRAPDGTRYRKCSPLPEKEELFEKYC